MKTIIAALVATVTLVAIAAPGVASAHHRHKVCSVHHHHRVCHLV